MGASDADIEQVTQAGLRAAAEKAAREDFEVHADNWEAWLFFLSVQTQWVFASNGMGAQRAGLNYPGVESGARMQRIPMRRWPELFEAVHAVELAVLAADEELASKAKGKVGGR